MHVKSTLVLINCTIFLRLIETQLFFFSYLKAFVSTQQQYSKQVNSNFYKPPTQNCI